jgi:hypothetical protein
MFFRGWTPSRGGVSDPDVLAVLCPRCSKRRFFGLAFLFLRCSRNLAEKSLAEVHYVVSQGAPQGHACDLVKAAYGQRRQPAIGS